jgi:class III poly(R)-hydroxyalkanoic acid synthase PhaE subunit
VLSALGSEQVLALVREQIRRLSEAAATAPLGAAAATWLGGFQSITTLLEGIGRRLAAPWADAAGELASSWQRAAQGDPEAFQHFVSTWKAAYDRTHGRLLAVPPLGLSREPTERFMLSLDAWVEYLAVLQEFLVLADRMARQAAETWGKRLSAIATETPPSHRDVYRLFIEAFEEHYEAVFRTEEYSHLQGRLLSAGVAFKTRWDGALEDLLQLLPVPTRSEINELYEAFHGLRRQVREQDRRIAGLGAALASTRLGKQGRR